MNIKQGLNNFGFTLIETLIVLILISLILGLSTILFSGSSASARIDSTAREIAATMKFARSLARINHEKQIITIDFDEKRYRIEGRKDREIPKDVQIKVVDSFSKEISSGKYIMVYPVTGSAGDDNIVLWNDKKELNIKTDPVVGSVIIK
ncbi:MAG: prepilin-type N-terminal cleavage/methylation domain-containing protein [Pseudomonadota bacterium]